MVLCTGCLRGDATRGPVTPEREFAGGEVVLGSPDLTAGIPGEGPLTVDEIQRWLANPHVHRPLEFTLPLGLSDAVELISIPPENQLTVAKIELGRQLFFDRRLSGQDTFACATCHIPEQDYTAYMVMPNIERNPPVSFNRLFSRSQFWDGRAESLEHQPTSPIKNPFEMDTTPEACVAKLKAIEGYRIQFEAIFGKLDFSAVSFALASFQRALVTGNSAWDYHRLVAEYESRDPATLSPEQKQSFSWLRRQAAADPMSEAAIRGDALFFGDRTRCSWCHTGPNLTDESFHNIGVGVSDSVPDWGRYKVTRRDEDRGAVKTPSLRNIARTPPYMHNGELETLEEVVDWFCQGGFAHEHLDDTIQPLDLTPSEKRDLVEFLKALTGPLPPVERKRLPE
jgi:cytochrome c peroxidase